MRWLVVLVAASGCLKLDLTSGVLLCNHTGKECPDGYHCAIDDYCYRNGDNPDSSAVADLSGNDSSSNDRTLPPADLTPIKHQGDSCVVGVDTCDTGHCVDGYCCENDCTDACGACNVTNQLGRCSPVTGPNHGSRTCNGSGLCGGFCAGASTACTYPSTSVLCGASCNGQCDGNGGCSASGSASCPNGFACGANACLTSCASPADCQEPSFTCQAPNCVRIPESDCLDGVDNNGDGLADCADPTCTATVECVAIPTGGLVGVLTGSSCPASFSTSQNVNQGLSAPLTCTGACSCNITSMTCHYDLTSTDSASYPCTATMFAAASFDVTGPPGAAPTSGGCQAPTPFEGNSTVAVSYTSLTCSTSGSPNPTQYTWGTNMSFCSTSSSSATCGAGQTCVAKPGVPVCAIFPTANATCPSPYPSPKGNWYHATDVSEGRSCSCPCNYSATDSNCVGGTWSYEYDQNCNDDRGAYTQSSLSECEPQTGGLALLGGFVVKTMGNSPPACSSTAKESGTAAPAGGQTICCQ
jgi:hypothetical protein